MKKRGQKDQLFPIKAQDIIKVNDILCASSVFHDIISFEPHLATQVLIEFMFFDKNLIFAVSGNFRGRGSIFPSTLSNKAPWCYKTDFYLANI